MKNPSLKVWLSITLGLFLIDLNAQEAIPASGIESSSSSGSVSSSIGQVIYTTNQNNAGSVSQGVQQGYTISSIPNGIDDSNVSLELAIYPNPTSDYLHLKVETIINQNLSYQLYDFNGRLIESGIMGTGEQQINMTSRAAATYFLKVLDNTTEIKTFRIIKN